jgi:hypothetical protein
MKLERHRERERERGRERERAKPLANGSSSAPIVPKQNRKPVTGFSLSSFRPKYDFPKTRSPFPSFDYCFLFCFCKILEKPGAPGGVGSHDMWRFDRTLTPLRVRHAPLFSFINFCTYLHAILHHIFPLSDSPAPWGSSPSDHNYRLALTPLLPLSYTEAVIYESEQG